MRPTRIEPGPGQESVWDYPRPPRVEASPSHVVIVLGDVEIVDSTRSLRVLETSSPPVHYVPLDDVLPGCLTPSTKTTYCEWKGVAAYFDVAAGGRAEPDGAWTYPQPHPGFEQLVGHVAFYPGRMDVCLLDGERVRPQPGSFYGGWITDRIVGPFKGDPGTNDW